MTRKTGVREMVAGALETMNNSFQQILSTNTSMSSNTGIKSSQSMVSSPVILAISVVVITVIWLVTFRNTLSPIIIQFMENIESLIKSTTSPPTPAPPTLPTPSPPPVQPVTPLSSNEVFNVAENIYTYEDAEPLCEALGAQLATYDQLQTAWKQGADWCNYGWSKGQLALYPTQKYTYNQLQKSSVKEQRGACGKIGVNGGYFEDRGMQLGVNCYGTKPTQTQHNTPIDSDTPPSFPPTTAQLEFNKKLNKYKTDSKSIKLNPFNSNSWSS